MRLRDLVDRFRRYVVDPRGQARMWRALRDCGIVARSPLFDRGWYLRGILGGAAFGEDPALHYLVAGHPAGLDPGPAFCGAEYLALNPDASGSNPLVHYERVGRRRGARVSFLQPLLADGRADPSWHFPTIEEHRAAFPAKVAAVRAKAARGERIRAVFFVASAAMFPARPLFDAMRRASRFDARLAVIPDFRRISCTDPLREMESCRATLARSYPPESFLPVAPNSTGQWPDILSSFGADIVCHSSPYELSDFHYNPRWCVGRPVLPVYVNYGYPCTTFAMSVMDLPNYAIQWKVFLESDYSLCSYREASRIDGVNGVVVGDVKMDTLATFPRNPGPRKRVLICPHHSVEGGANDALALSNFLRLADFFVGLPARFPELDFLFRPHPFLFPVLSRPKFWGPAKCAVWRERFLAHPNAAWSDGGDPLRDFAASDAIVQDCSSFLPEWMFTGRPCCYILKKASDVSKFLPVGRECLARYTIAQDAARIEAFLRDVVLGGRDGLAAERESFRRKLAVNWPHAAGAALEAICHDLGMDERDVDTFLLTHNPRIQAVGVSAQK